MPLRPALPSALLALLLLGPAALAAPPSGVKVIDLGAQGTADAITATDMNDAGAVVGYRRASALEVPHVVVWKDRKVTDLGTASPRARPGAQIAPQIANDGSVLVTVPLPNDPATCGYSCRAIMLYQNGSWRELDQVAHEGGAVRLTDDLDVIGAWTYRNMATGNWPWNKVWVAEGAGAWTQLSDAGDEIEERIESTTRNGLVLTRRSVPGPPPESRQLLRRAPTYDAVDLPAGYIWRTVLPDGRVVGAKTGDPTPKAWTPAGGVQPFPTFAAVDAQRVGVLATESIPDGSGGSVFHPRLYRPDGTVIDLDTWRPAGAPWDGLVLWSGRRVTPGGELLLDARSLDGLSVHSVVVLRRVVISGTVAGAGGAAPTRAATRAATRATVVATGEAGTFTAGLDARGRFSLEVIPGTYRLAVQGRTGCVVVGGRCAATQVVDASRSVVVRLLADPRGVRLALGVAAGARLAVARGRIAIPVRCVATATCRGTVALRKGRKTLASQSVTVRAGKARIVRLAVGKRRGAATVRASAGGRTASAAVRIG